jgi:hypothetical protein
MQFGRCEFVYLSDAAVALLQYGNICNGTCMQMSMPKHTLNMNCGSRDTTLAGNWW